MGMVVEGSGPESGARLRDLEAVAALVSDGIVSLDPEGRVVGWNRAAASLTGYLPEEMIGRPVSVLYTEEERAEGLIEAELGGARESGRFDGEGWRVRKDGSRFRAEVTVAPVTGAGGELTGYVKLLRDVTGRRADQSMFNALLESAPDAMVVVSPDGRIALVNRQTEVMFGYTRDELVGQPIEVLVPQRLRGRHVHHRDGFFAAPQMRPMGMDLDLFGVRKDGSELPVEISLSPLATDGGKLVCAAIRDVTERREQAERLKRQRDEIMELSTPVIQVWDRVLALPIIGTLDSGRAARLTEELLEKISELQAEVIILDISGVPTVDTLVAQHLLKTVQAATLMGATSILSGVRPETAQAIVHLGIDLGRLRSRNTLREALQLALQVIRDRSTSATAAAADVAGAAGVSW
ncbi:PAS domain S-box protein [Catenulispora subtropica]|uniref:PAS/PAC sensor protein n=1 Tax=Catenulispora subtropica TaxID=450798 RepID=A0ABP5EIY3_9ACTN